MRAIAKASTVAVVLISQNKLVHSIDGLGETGCVRATACSPNTITSTDIHHNGSALGTSRVVQE